MARNVCWTMKTHDATFSYARPLPSGGNQLHLDLLPALPQSHDALHDAFKGHFSLAETNEISGLVRLRREATLDKFLAFFGCTWNDTQQRWPNLAWMVEYRKQHGCDAYAGPAGHALSNDALARFADLVCQWASQPLETHLAADRLAHIYRRALGPENGKSSGGFRSISSFAADFCAAAAPLRQVPELSALPATTQQASALLRALAKR